ncbi:hypothetical protein IWQ56_000208 [Coemansia nantahalensis]|nr:hypothetical protein IWQ56_000208 [Coemansia nantahalensis]
MLRALLLASLVLHAERVSGADTGAAADELPHKVAVPAFAPYLVPEAALWEQFAGDPERAWKRSHAAKAGRQEDRYDGEWAFEDVAELAGVAGDRALVAKSEARHHAISTVLGQPFDPAQRGLVLQYEVKLQSKLNCGGAYVKLLTAPVRGEFSDATPYTIMFGPDKCGDAKVHLIFRHRNPLSGEYTEHHLTRPPVPPTDGLSHVYTLAVHTNNTFTLSIDATEKRSGTLFDDFAPPVNPPKEIDDPDDHKPADWVDDASIPDPDAEKPADWDEDAPRMVPDDDAAMPKAWLVDEPPMVEDPAAKKPADWDDDEDGDWSGPMVANPRCATADGCGPWERPLKRNPAYKGKWSAPLVDNPRYKGAWAPRRIDNPAYFEDRELYRLSAVGGVGFELWTMQSGITFDNIYLGDSVAAAAQIAEDVWKPKHDTELAVHAALNPKPPAHTAVSGVLDSFRARFDEIYASIGAFYDMLRTEGLVSAFRGESRGAVAAAMVTGGLAWLVWNVLLLVRLFSPTPAVAPQRAPAAGGAPEAAATASSTARPATRSGDATTTKRK